MVNNPLLEHFHFQCLQITNAGRGFSPKKAALHCCLHVHTRSENALTHLPRNIKQPEVSSLPNLAKASADFSNNVAI